MGSVIDPNASINRANNKPVSIGRIVAATFILRGHLIPSCEGRIPEKDFTTKLSFSIAFCYDLNTLGIPVIQLLPRFM